MRALRLTRRSTRRRDTPPPVRTALGGVAVIVLMAVLGWQALAVYNGVPGKDYGQLFVSTPQVGNLLSHDPVRVAGARVGQVSGRDIGADGKPRIELQIEPGVKLPRDTQVAVRGAGLLGARYIELIPGKSSQSAPDGTVLRGTDASYTFGVSETLDTFDKETRGRFGDMLGGLGQGFQGNGEALNDGIHTVTTRTAEFGAFAAEVLEREGAAGRLLPAMDSALRPLDANRRSLADLTAVADDALEPFIARKKEIRQTLEEAPPALTALRPGLVEGERLLASVRGAAVTVNRTLAPAPAGLRSLTALLRGGGPSLARAHGLLKAVRPAVPAALRLTDALRPVLLPVQRVLSDSSEPMRQTAKYSCDVVNFATVMRSMTGFTQPGEGPGGPAQAFRLQLVYPVSTDVVGVKDDSQRNKREGVVAPCKYLAKPYPQSNETP